METATITEAPTLDLVSQNNNDPGSLMVLIPAGEYKMGEESTRSQEECAKIEIGSDCELTWFEGEEPIHTVDLDAFWIDIYEVNNIQFTEFLNATDNQENIGIWIDSEDIDLLIEINAG